VIKTADWIIDLGPEGGDKGGEIVAVGTPEQVVTEPRSYTGRYLKPLLEGAGVAPVTVAKVAAKPKARAKREKVAAE
jgi:excinuclease ABC subunit A